MRTIWDFSVGVMRDAAASIRSWPLWRKLVVGLLVVGMIIITFTVKVPSLATMNAWAAGTGQWFVMVFVFGYVVVTQFPIPRTIFTLSSGVLFGPWLGIVVALTATTVSAAVSLSVVRYFLGIGWRLGWRIRRLRGLMPGCGPGDGWR